jgi:hypothetical protein
MKTLTVPQENPDRDVGRRDADLIVEAGPSSDLFIIKPSHRCAAVWLTSIGEGVSVSGRCLDDFIAAAVRAGFTVGFRLSTGDLVITTPEPTWAGR